MITKSSIWTQTIEYPNPHWLVTSKLRNNKNINKQTVATEGKEKGRAYFPNLPVAFHFNAETAS